MTQHSADCGLPRAALIALLKEHRPNYVTEGVVSSTASLSTQRTRVKCEGATCDFYAVHASWFTALDLHTYHLADVLSSVTAPASGTHDPIALTAPSDSQAAMGPREGQPSGSAPAAPPPGGAATPGGA